MFRYLITAGLLSGLTCFPALAEPLVPGDAFQRLENGYIWQHPAYPTIIDGRAGAWGADRLLDNEGKPVLCAATGDHQKLTFTVGRNSIQILVNDPGWSLEPGSYPMTLTVSSVTQTFNMNTTGSTTLWSNIDPKDLVALIGAMNKAPRADLDQGGASKRTVSLAGSTKALDLFRVCAIWSEVNTPGGSPAASSLVRAMTSTK